MINIKILKDYAEVSYEIKNTNKKQTKVISISDIPSLFDTNITFDSGCMPIYGKENCYGIQRIIQKDNQIIALVQCLNPFVNVLHTEETKLTETQKLLLGINHLDKDNTEKVGENTCYKNIYFPNLLMSLQLKKNARNDWQLDKTGILCYQDHFITDNTQLYQFPFSNIYKESSYGSICWGSQEAKADSIGQTIAVIHSFLGGVMNTHLFNKFKIKDFEFECSSEVLAYLALRSEELDSFPYKDFDLKKIIKYGELINYLNHNWK